MKWTGRRYFCKTGTNLLYYKHLVPLGRFSNIERRRAGGEAAKNVYLPVAVFNETLCSTGSCKTNVLRSAGSCKMSFRVCAVGPRGKVRSKPMRKAHHGIKPISVLPLGFVAIIITGALLLMLPIASRGGASLPFIDALFTATSASCVTGLVVVDTAHILHCLDRS